MKKFTRKMTRKIKRLRVRCVMHAKNAKEYYKYYGTLAAVLVLLLSAVTISSMSLESTVWANPAAAPVTYSAAAEEQPRTDTAINENQTETQPVMLGEREYVKEIADDGTYVVEIENPESKAFDDKIEIVDSPPPLRSVDKIAQELAVAYDKAEKAPQPYLEPSGRINFYFGTMTPRIVCRPLRLTDIELEAGEMVQSVNIADSARWSVAPATSGRVDNLVTHVIVKPMIPDIATNLVIHTDRRTYMLELVSITSGQYMSFVGFIYPNESNNRNAKAADEQAWNALLSQYKQVEGLKRGKAEVSPNNPLRIDPSKVNLDYAIVANKKGIVWKPKNVYDVGGKTYFVMNPKIKVTEAPVLYVRLNGKEKLVNYRVLDEGAVYELDRLFDVAVLLAGGDKVTVKRRVPLGREAQEKQGRAEAVEESDSVKIARDTK